MDYPGITQGLYRDYTGTTQGLNMDYTGDYTGTSRAYKGTTLRPEHVYLTGGARDYPGNREACLPDRGSQGPHTGSRKVQLPFWKGRKKHMKPIKSVDKFTWSSLGPSFTDFH